MVEDLLYKLNALETNFTIVDGTVPLISPATRVRLRFEYSYFVNMYVHVHRSLHNMYKLL